MASVVLAVKRILRAMAITATLQWQYLVKTVKNPDVGSLQNRINQLGAEGWELVSMVSTIKTWVNLTGNDLVLTLKRPGLGEFTEQPDVTPY